MGLSESTEQEQEVLPVVTEVPVTTEEAATEAPAVLEETVAE